MLDVPDKMDYFFIPHINKDDLHQTIMLPEEESHHATRVLRKKAGDLIGLMDGKGNIASGVISELHKKNTSVRVDDFTFFPKRKPIIDIYVGFPKGNDRIEWMLEKSTELGVNSITPLQLQHSERKMHNTERGAKILKAACKQSKNPYLPILNEEKTLDQVVIEINQTGVCIFGHCKENEKKHTVSSVVLDQEHVHVIIGPEGDFSTPEIEFIQQQKNAFPIDLGPLRLRTETAAITSIIQVQSAFLKT